MNHADYDRWLENCPPDTRDVLQISTHVPLSWLLHILISDEGYLVILVELSRELARRASESHNRDEQERLLKLVRELTSIVGGELRP